MGLVSLLLRGGAWEPLLGAIALMGLAPVATLQTLDAGFPD